GPVGRRAPRPPARAGRVPRRPGPARWAGGAVAAGGRGRRPRRPGPALDRNRGPAGRDPGSRPRSHSSRGRDDRPATRPRPPRPRPRGPPRAPPPPRGGGGGGGGGAAPPRGARVRYFGDYELLALLGRGGMGVVYRARQLSLHRLVAVKMLRAGAWAGEDEVRRFRNEAEAVAELDHAGIVPIYEGGEHHGRHYFSMKLVEGVSLADRLADYAADPRAAARLVGQVARAVHHAHMRGILHRDLKPANILLDAEGHPHVTDFGLARRVEGDPGLTESGAVVGTPGYMAPEQAEGRRRGITTATDVSGLGAVLYACLTGRAPFEGDSVVAVLDQVRQRPPQRPGALNRRADRDVETICLKCLEKDPRRRYASADAGASDLGRYLSGEPIQARRTGVLERAAKWARRRPAIAALLAAVVLVAVAGFGGVLW